MMPDLGKYAFSVLGAYGATLGLLGVLILFSWIKSRSIKRRLDAAEARRHG